MGDIDRLAIRWKWKSFLEDISSCIVTVNFALEALNSFPRFRSWRSISTINYSSFQLPPLRILLLKIIMLQSAEERFFALMREGPAANRVEILFMLNVVYCLPKLAYLPLLSALGLHWLVFPVSIAFNEDLQEMYSILMPNKMMFIS